MWINSGCFFSKFNRLIRTHIGPNAHGVGVMRGSKPCSEGIEGRFRIPITNYTMHTLEVCSRTRAEIAKAVGAQRHEDRCNQSWDFCWRFELLSLALSISFQIACEFQEVLYESQGSWCISRVPVFRKILVSVKFLSAILGPETAAPILWTRGKIAFFLQENPCP